jgi:hypothetical protein
MNKKIDISVDLKLLEESFSGLEQINTHTQTAPKSIVRWSLVKRSWLYTLFHPKARVRHQDLLQHSLGMVMLLINISLKLKKHIPGLENFLLVQAATTHDFGEIEMKRDVCFLDKGINHDHEEYAAFIKKISCLGEELTIFHRRAFLLQFADNPKSWEHFSEKDQKILSSLHYHSHMETLIFKYSERLEYILFALEQGNRLKNHVIVEEVLRHHIPDMRRACELIPGWRKEIWSDEMDALATSIQKKLAASLPKLFRPD